MSLRGGGNGQDVWLLVPSGCCFAGMSGNSATLSIPLVLLNGRRPMPLRFRQDKFRRRPNWNVPDAKLLRARTHRKQIGEVRYRAHPNTPLLFRFLNQLSGVPPGDHTVREDPQTQRVRSFERVGDPVQTGRSFARVFLWVKPVVLDFPSQESASPLIILGFRRVYIQL